MRKQSLLGCESKTFTETEWFSCGSDIRNYICPFYVEDMIHIATKLRNFLLRTLSNRRKLPFGNKSRNKYYIELEHLYVLLNRFTKDKHQLTASTLNPADKQNFSSVLRMCDQRVTDLLRSSVKNSEATIKFLKIIRMIIDSYMDHNLSPLERLNKI